MRLLLSMLGFASVGFGVAGIFIPVWPSTVFFIVAAALFAKSNPKAERWLLEHAKIGPGLKNWREQGAIARKAKVVASFTILISFLISIYFIGALWLQTAMILTALCLIIFIFTRPEPKIELPFTNKMKGNDAA